jgi:PAS domain S-box-containing protein
MSEGLSMLDQGDDENRPAGAGSPFAAAFRTARAPMVITDPRLPDNPIIDANDAFFDLTGYGADEVIGRNCRFLQGPDTDPAHVRVLRDALREERGIDVEILNYRKDGSSFWNMLSISPVPDENGRAIYFFASQRDVSMRHDVQVELSRAKKWLEDEVALRTADLQIAVDQKTVLLHEVDHRVKNSLQVVTSLVLLKARRLKDPAAQQALMMIAERVSALSTVHRLLYGAPDFSHLDMAEFISELARDLEPDPSSGVSIALDLEPLPVAASKAAPLALLVNEAVVNALSHAFPDGRAGRVRISSSAAPGAGRIVVEDDGTGMAEWDEGGPGFGRALIGLLARQIKARVEVEDGRPGTRIVVDLSPESGITA